MKKFGWKISNRCYIIKFGRVFKVSLAENQINKFIASNWNSWTTLFQQTRKNEDRKWKCEEDRPRQQIKQKRNEKRNTDKHLTLFIQLNNINWHNIVCDLQKYRSFFLSFFLLLTIFIYLFRISLFHRMTRDIFSCFKFKFIGKHKNVYIMQML